MDKIFQGFGLAFIIVVAIVFFPFVLVYLFTNTRYFEDMKLDTLAILGFVMLILVTELAWLWILSMAIEGYLGAGA